MTKKSHEAFCRFVKKPENMYLPLDKIIQQQNTSNRIGKSSYAPVTEVNVNTSPTSSSARSDRFNNGSN